MGIQSIEVTRGRFVFRVGSATPGYARWHEHNQRGVDVDFPVRVAYDQWTQFETFPRLKEGVREIRNFDDTHTHWVLDIAGQTREFEPPRR